MPASLRRQGYAPAVLTLFLAALLACNWAQDLQVPLLSKSTVVPTRAELPTAVTQEPTAPATVVPIKPTVERRNSDDPSQDPCSLPGIAFRAIFTTAGTNALTAPFTGDVTILKTPSGPNIFSIQEASVQRKFVILLPNLNPAVYDLSSTYMSYTEKTGPNDKNPKVWKADFGLLQVELCKEGGMALRTVVDAVLLGSNPARFGPLPAKNNTAAGSMLIVVGAKIK